MKIEQLYTGCLSEAAYYIESNGEVAIIDPLREVQPYVDMAEENNSTIKYVFETHFHADFVSGHVDLAETTGATIVYGPTADPAYEVHVAKDGEIFELGYIKIKVLHTPGHTMESSTYLLIDEEGREHAIFTGDALLIGDVGRPDLAVSTDLSRADLAGHLFDSLRNKIMPLPDSIIVYPNHGPGSACGKKMSDETVDTLGHQKKVNYALRADMTKEEFVKEVTSGLVAPPQYFPKNAAMNKAGYESIFTVLDRGLISLKAEIFKDLVDKNDVLVIDARERKNFLKGFIEDAIYIGIDDDFAPWAGALIHDLKQPITFLCEAGKEQDVVTRLARVGYDNVLGYLEGGYQSWADAGYATDSMEEISAKNFANMFDENLVYVMDVRKASEFKSQHLKDAVNAPLETIYDELEKLDKHKKYYLQCQKGYRSVIAGSILRANGFKKLVNIEGGFEEIKNYCIKVTKYEEPETML